MRKRTQAREYALQLLYQVDLTACSPEEACRNFWELHETSPDIRSFTERLVIGTMKERASIDDVIARYAENWDMTRMAVVDRNILRFATYELLYLEDIPPKVTINEAVNMAKKFSQDDSGKFVNGVLDKICHAESKKSKMTETSEPES